MRLLPWICLIPAIANTLRAASPARTWDGAGISSSQRDVSSIPRGLELHVAFRESLNDLGTDNTALQRTDETFAVDVVCTWTNVSKKKLTFLLKDHDAYYGTVAFPWGLFCHLEADEGSPAANSIAKYWKLNPRAFSSSHMSKVEPGDTVTLRPKESVTQIISLEDLLTSEVFNLEEKSHFAPGTYEVKLTMGDIESVETLKLHIRPKTAPANSAGESANPDAVATK